MNARSRCSLPMAERIASGRVAAFPPISVAARAPAPIPVLAADLGDIALNDTSDRRDI